MGKLAPNTPHDAFNFWTTVEPSVAWTVGGGFTAVSHRYADTDNTAGVPSYVVFNAMTSYQVNDHLKLQLNLNNVTDKLYFTGIYYTGDRRKITPCRAPAARSSAASLSVLRDHGRRIHRRAAGADERAAPRGTVRAGSRARRGLGVRRRRSTDCRRRRCAMGACCSRAPVSPRILWGASIGSGARRFERRPRRHQYGRALPRQRLGRSLKTRPRRPHIFDAPRMPATHGRSTTWGICIWTAAAWRAIGAKRTRTT